MVQSGDADSSEPAAAEPEYLSPGSGEERAARIDEAAIDELLSDTPPQRLSVDGTRPDEPESPAQSRLGSEGLSRLRARHAEVLARISEAVTDQVRRDELKSQAERLNPDTWVTDAEVTQGLESYETVFESLRTVVGRGRRRRRRSGGGARDAGASVIAPGPEPASSDSPGGDDGDADETTEDL